MRNVTTVPQRLAALRQAMAHHQVAGLLIPSSDPHLSEYLPGHWQGREWASGFTGSMGTLAVTAAEAALFADSRYWTQADNELSGSGIELVKIGGPGGPGHAEWLATHVSAGGVVAVDGRVIGLAAHQALAQRLKSASIELRTDLDLLGEAWPDRPALSLAAIREHLPPHASMSRQEKLDAVRADMRRLGCTHHLVSTLDDIAWLFNLRGQDVDYNPVFLAHALIALDTATLFIDARKVPPPVEASLAQDQVSIAPYDGIAPALSALPQDAHVLLDPRRLTLAQRDAISVHAEVLEHLNPTVLLKSRKTDADASHVREVMARDGAAMANFYAWFEDALGREFISELTVDERLTAERAKQAEFVSLSFPTIAGFNSNGAMPHYRALPASHAVISTPQGIASPGLLLIDSGGQYLGGTTDITRVWPIGQASAAQRRDFTLVLRAMINLSRARFPAGTLAPMLDALARAPLWEQGLDYGHGTGHGVGYFLNVHEGPQSISKAIPDTNMAMQLGMITSNEPALYRAGQWGVRIENLLLNVSSTHQEMGEFLAFETLTLCPIDTRCIDVALLRDDELDWLNRYHQDVWCRVSPLTTGRARDWLETRTRALSR